MKEKLTYYQQTQHPLWQKKRLEVLKLHNFTCQECESTETTLHVHHPIYKRGAMIWDYDKSELMCLCEICHKESHELDERLKKSLSISSSWAKEMTLGVIDAEYQLNMIFFKEGKSDKDGIERQNNKAHLIISSRAYAYGVAFRFAPLIFSDILKLAEKSKTKKVLISTIMKLQHIKYGELHNG